MDMQIWDCLLEHNIHVMQKSHFLHKSHDINVKQSIHKK